jgi:ABC-type nitrate/sulfonate/bicarbonate transport system substrate-binding protein
VLAFRTEWALSHKEEVSALAEAVGDASRWAASPSNRSSLVTLLTSTAGKDVIAAMLERILDTPASTSGGALVASGLRLDEDAIKADPAQALWLFAQMVAAGQTTYSDALAEKQRPPSMRRP